MHRRAVRAALIAATTIGLFACGGESPRSESSAVNDQAIAASRGQCRLQAAGGAIRHVIYIQFDNTHFMRDLPNVPSDLEQMPHLLDFITGSGTLLSNHHTPLISHTASDIVTSLTGLYPDRHGIAVANSYRAFNANGTSSYAPAFTYWTDPVSSTDTRPNMVGADGKNTPAPWVAYTRAGCDFGAAGIANMELENTAGDITTVFGAGSTQAQEAKSNAKQATADFVGIAVHCTSGSALCGDGSGAMPDVLPDEPGGYTGYQALFGHKYVAPKIAPSGLVDLNGQPVTGFPGFDGMGAAVTLAYVASMQEAGVPVTYAYISDAHDNHAGGGAYGPGQAGYVAQLAADDAAFAAFFDRLARDGIDRSNTLFVFTADEGDHFVGGAPSPADCDGVNTPCTYSQIGEIDVNLTALLAQSGVTSPFQIAQSQGIYVNGNPTPADATTRAFERASGGLTLVNPITSGTEPVADYLADPAEMGVLHMRTGDPARMPTFTLFVNPNLYLYTGSSTCSATSPCVQEEAAYAWNHGMVSPDVNRTWLGLVGPGVRAAGVDDDVWSDHTDVRPTMLALVGLTDDYVHQGRVLAEALRGRALPDGVRHDDWAFEQLARAYKRVNAPTGPFALATLRLATQAARSGDASDDSEFSAVESWLSQLEQQRDGLVGRMEQALDAAEFHGVPVDVGAAWSMALEADALTAIVEAAAR
jgi:arylsulfatase A-like enzyme